jgi:hypothetical protein
MACCAILLDAMTVGKLNDDRPIKGAAGRLQAQYAAPASSVVLPDPAEVLRERLESADDDSAAP